jgi:23S rRNA (guanine2445-N2)-methyltransferase / 23S rRNA (guanine2069-N7)-methyltransferase
MSIKLFISCPKGVENPLQDELTHLGLIDFKQTVGGIYCSGEFEQVYDVCLWSRLANRVVWLLDQKTVNSTDDIYRCVNRITWPAVFPLTKTFAVDFKGTNKFIIHTNYGALLVKDAIVDHFKEEFGERPNVGADNSNVKIYAHLKHDQFIVGVDVSGGSLHRRGYRLEGAKAPLKENLAAALMLRAGVKENDERILIDPLCGSGTLLIEGVLIRLGISPSVLREHFGFEHLVRHKSSVWQKAYEEAKQQRDTAIEKARLIKEPLAKGYDQDARVIEAANNNAERAGLDGIIEFKQQALIDFSVKPDQGPILLATNPPYGERLEERNTLFSFYQLLGEKIRQYCQGSQAAVLSSDDNLLKALALQKSKVYQFNNGTLPAQWMLFEIYKKEQQGEDLAHDPRFEQAVEMVSNRLRKNQKRLKNWLKQQQLQAYRVYDADMPEYAFALDCYGEKYQLTEYAPPKSVDKFGAFQRRQQFEKAVKDVFQIRDHQLIYKERRQQKGKAQYEKISDSRHYFSVQEYNAQFLVNLHDYLDTGLFLDHRPVRKMIAAMAKGKRFLNLFSYTSAATVHAALGGAKSSVSVDMSNTYIEWSEKNFKANNVDVKRHQLIRENCLLWLARCQDTFDVIFLDPPSFSNSKKMEGTFDVLRDQQSLIDDAMRILSPDGTLIFSNNRRDFTLDAMVSEKYDVENISAKTIDVDFERNAKIHQCWLIRHK